MVKLYEQWVVEGRDLSAPVSVEHELGTIKVFADPNEENWEGETVRIELYEDLLSELEEAAEEKDDDKLKSLLKDVRDLPLFSNDKSNVFKGAQIDGEEFNKEKDNDRLFVAYYAIKKIKIFLDWCNDK